MVRCRLQIYELRQLDKFYLPTFEYLVLLPHFGLHQRNITAARYKTDII